MASSALLLASCAGGPAQQRVPTSSTEVPPPAQPAGEPLACPFPGPPDGQVATAQAGDCVMHHWASGDRAGAVVFSTGDAAVAALFGTIPAGEPSALGCAPAPAPAPPGDPAGDPRPVACRYALAQGGVATVLVDSVPERGAVVFATSVA
ncbi:MAG TPA: hypothetical protein VFJ85_05320 [Acidimicrobiales bacterium]|nr:hypothetical protein [Acidimicrobiales bacterium]